MKPDYPFKWRHYQAEVALLCVCGYLRYPISYRNLEENLRFVSLDKLIPGCFMLKQLSVLLVFAAVSCLVPVAQSADEGIKVHGHWKLEIFNTDGSLDREVAFQNSLIIGGGDEVLASLLAKKTTLGEWVVVLAGVPAGQGAEPSVCEFAGNPSFCTIVTASSVDPNANSNNLTVSQLIGQMQLNGSVTAAIAGSIGEVLTHVDMCDPNISPDACIGAAPTTASLSFSSKTIPAVAVQQGQVVQAMVTFSFQ
jgi:hypothetical protein